MCEMTSMGEMSAARMTMPAGRDVGVLEGRDVGDLRRALTTSFTPRLRARDAAAVVEVSFSFLFSQMGLCF